MLCITGLETDTGALLKRLERFRAFPMHEVRLDALRDPLPPPSRLPVPCRKLMLTCRRPEDGGLRKWKEDERLRFLMEALRLEPGWLDLEADLSKEAAEPVLQAARRKGTRVVRSLHRMEPCGPGVIAKELARLERVEGDGIKLAVHVEAGADLQGFLHAPRDRAAVLIGMGPAGLLSRVLHRRFGSAWTYVSAEPWPDRTAGIPDLEAALRYDMPVSIESRLFVLLGDASINASPGPRVYNRLFRKRRFRGVYLAVPTKKIEAALSMLRSLHLAGASVTVPHKAAAAAQADRLSETAREAGAVNTLYPEREGAWTGDNTDVPALEAVVKRLAKGPIHRAAVLGTGGFARAAAVALSRLGAEVTLFGRSAPAVSGPWKEHLPLEALERAVFDVWVNATPLGRHEGEDPLAGHAVNLAGKVVIDGVLASEPTTLLTRAAKAGAATAGGYEVWVEQGARQMALFRGPTVDAAELAALL